MTTRAIKSRYKPKNNWCLMKNLFFNSAEVPFFLSLMDTAMKGMNEIKVKMMVK